MKTAARSPRVRRGARVGACAALLGAVCLLASGCSTHDEPVSHPCTVITKSGKVVVVDNRGGIGLPKVGLTPRALKAQEKCT